MTGKLFQILNEEAEQIGLIWCEDINETEEQFAAKLKCFLDSEDYDENVDVLEEWLNENFVTQFERAYTEEIYLNP